MIQSLLHLSPDYDDDMMSQDRFSIEVPFEDLEERSVQVGISLQQFSNQLNNSASEVFEVKKRNKSLEESDSLELSQFKEEVSSWIKHANIIMEEIREQRTNLEKKEKNLSKIEKKYREENKINNLIKRSTKDKGNDEKDNNEEDTNEEDTDEDDTDEEDTDEGDRDEGDRDEGDRDEKDQMKTSSEDSNYFSRTDFFRNSKKKDKKDKKNEDKIEEKEVTDDSQKGNLEKSEIGTVGSHDNIIESTITNELLKDIILPGSTMTSSAIEAINNVDNLQRELIETEERAQKAEMRMIEMEEELIKNRETIRKLQKQLGVLSENSQKKIILEKPKLDEVIEIPETNIKDSDIEAEDSEKTKRKISTKKEPIKKRRTSSVSKKRKTSKK